MINFENFWFRRIIRKVVNVRCQTSDVENNCIGVLDEGLLKIEDVNDCRVVYGEIGYLEENGLGFLGRVEGLSRDLIVEKYNQFLK